MNTLLMRFSIKDSAGDHNYDYADDFLVDLDYTVPEGTPDNQVNRTLFQQFKVLIKKAVADWFAESPEDVRYEIEQYGYGYDFETEGGDGEAEVDYAIRMLPARSVAHIPENIMEANGFRLAPAPSMDVEFYHDDGFLADND